MENGHQKKRRKKTARFEPKGNGGSALGDWQTLRASSRWSSSGPPILQCRWDLMHGTGRDQARMGREGMGRSGEDMRQLVEKWGDRSWAVSTVPLTRAIRLVSLMPLNLRASPRMIWGLASGTYTVASFGITSCL